VTYDFVENGREVVEILFMKKTIVSLLVLGVGLLHLQAGDLSWNVGNISKPLQQAKAQKKLLLLDFTGSDWCGYCKKLEAEVFESPEFAAYAKTNLVLVKVDFPKSFELPSQLKNINEALMRRYAAPFKGYPTIVVLDAQGNKLGQTSGYSPGSGPEAFIAKIEKLAKKS
jgi:thioredoxin-related protein